MKRKRTTLYLDPDVYAWLAEAAKSERRTISSMNQFLLDWHRQNNKPLLQKVANRQENTEQYSLKMRRHETLKTAAQKLAEAAEDVLAGSDKYNDLAAEIHLNPNLDSLKEEEKPEEVKTVPLSELDRLLTEIREEEES
tara:strand:- start:515 stop:931 length:417 start_codon:yes stop_codon:yes gene_type:complete